MAERVEHLSGKAGQSGRGCARAGGGSGRRRGAMVGLLLILGGLWPSAADGGKVVLKSGYEIPGVPVQVPGMTSKIARSNQGQNVPQTPYWLVDDGVRRYFVHRQNLRPAPEGVVESDESSRYVHFTLQVLRNRKDAIPAQIGSFAEATPWDEFGRCRVTLTTPRGPEHVFLAITRIEPRCLTVESTSHAWTFGLDPTAIPQERLRQIIRGAIDPRNPDDRLAVVTFFLQTEQLGAVRAELESIRDDFPELHGRVEELQKMLFERYGLQALAEIVRLRRIGQHEFARFLARRTLQEDLSASTLRDVQSILDEYDQADRDMAAARLALGTLQAELPPEQAARVAVVRSMIERELNYDSLPRLTPFLQAMADANQPAADRLALACSGWLLGPANAKTHLGDALSLWDARFAVLEYLHPETDRGDRQTIIERLKKLEGVSVESVARMIPFLPPPLEPGGNGQALLASYELPPTLDSDVTVRYSVLVPAEYHPTRSYPVLVVLRPEGRSVEEALAFWGGRVGEPGWAQREGYIVIAPDYAPPTAATYDYGRLAHDVVLRALFDARHRFRIDSDRVFLTGHGMGGDAAYDLALAHPDVWAGVIPFTGRFQHAARLAADNAPDLPFYVVGGERDRDTLNVNDVPLSTRMQRGYDLIYCEYKQRGFEWYAEELPRIFRWMSLHRRPAALREIRRSIVRDFDNRVGWLKWVDLPEDLSQPIAWGPDQRPPRPKPVIARIPTSQTIFVSAHPGRHTVVWLAPDLVDYEQRVKISVNSSRPFNDFPQPDFAALLDDLRERGDRERLYWTKLTF